MRYGCRAVRGSFHLVHLLVERVEIRAALISFVQSRAFGEVGHRFLETVAVISGRVFAPGYNFFSLAGSFCFLFRVSC